MNAFSYICTDGHVDPAPSMGSYSSCQVLVPVWVGGRQRGACPCGRAVARVPYDPTLEAAYRVGGVEAVKELLATRGLPDVVVSAAKSAAAAR